MSRWRYQSCVVSAVMYLAKSTSLCSDCVPFHPGYLTVCTECTCSNLRFIKYLIIRFVDSRTKVTQCCHECALDVRRVRSLVEHTPTNNNNDFFSFIFQTIPALRRSILIPFCGCLRTTRVPILTSGALHSNGHLRQNTALGTSQNGSRTNSLC